MMLALVSVEMFIALSQCGHPEFIASPARVAVSAR